MAKVEAKSALDMRVSGDLNFGGSGKLDTTNQSKTMVKAVYKNGESDTFVGSFSFSGGSKQVSGTATQWIHAKGQTTQWKLTALTLSAPAVEAAIKTASMTDDAAIVTQMLSKGDTIIGSKDADHLFGYAGNDTIQSHGGIDTINGGDGVDRVIFTEQTRNVMLTLKGSTATYAYFNGVKADRIFNVEEVAAGSGNDKLTGDDVANVLIGNDGDDTLTGNGGNDTLVGGAGRDSLMGGLGNDKVYGGDGNDYVDGGSGHDRLEGGTANDTLVGGTGKDTLLGGSGKDTLQGGSGIDSLDGGDGNDSLDGGADGDLLKGGNNNDTLLGAAGADKLFGGNGDDSIDGGAESDLLDGGIGKDTMLGGTGNDTLLGGMQNDLLDGGASADSLDGGSGLDTLIGGEGRDTLTGGADADVFRYLAITDSPNGVPHDIITDFVHLSDKFDLSAIDANETDPDDQAFVLDAKGNSSTPVAEGHIGWYTVNKSGIVNDRTYIRINTNADAAIEMTIELKGLKVLTADDFIL